LRAFRSWRSTPSRSWAGSPRTASDALFGVFVVLKTLYAVSLALPQWEPATPPRWLNQLMTRLPNVRTGEEFSDAWAKDRTEEADRRVRNDQPWSGRRPPRDAKSLGR
jgi:hypothetical protein